MKIHSSFFLFLILIGQAWCGGYRTPHEMREAIDTVNQFPLTPSVCSISTNFSDQSNAYGTGVCVDPEWVATSLHLVAHPEIGDDLRFSFEDISPESIKLDSIIEFPGQDIALIKLRRSLPRTHVAPLISWEAYQSISNLLSGNKEIPYPAFFCGYGDKIASGPLLTMPSRAHVTKALNKEMSAHFPDYVGYRKSIARVTLSEYGFIKDFEGHPMFASHYHTSTEKPYELESFALPGDSGSPLIVQLDDQKSYVMGLTTKTFLGEWDPQVRKFYQKKTYSGIIKTIFSSIYSVDGKSILQIAQEQDSLS